MKPYNFSGSLQRLLAQARKYALAQRQTYISDEHLLVGMLLDGDNAACAVLTKLNIDLSKLIGVAEQVANSSEAKGRPVGPDLPYSTGAQSTLELALASAEEFGSAAVGPEHLLMAMMSAPTNVATQVLTAMGASRLSVRNQIMTLTDSVPSAHSLASARSEITGVLVAVYRQDGSVERKEFTSPFWALHFLQEQW